MFDIRVQRIAEEKTDINSTKLLHGNDNENNFLAEESILLICIPRFCLIFSLNVFITMRQCFCPKNRYNI